MMVSIRKALILTVAALLFGCSKTPAEFDAVKYDAKRLAISKYKGDDRLFSEVSDLCVSELNRSDVCDGKGAQRLFSATASDLQAKWACSQAVKASTQLPACRTLSEAGTYLDLIAAQRPQGHYNEQSARAMWGARFIDISE